MPPLPGPHGVEVAVPRWTRSVALPLFVAAAALLSAGPAAALQPPPIHLLTWGSTGNGPGQFMQPLCVAADPFGTVYVTDYNLNTVQEFSSTGTWYSTFGGTGTGPGLFSGAAGITVDNTYTVHVTDSGNHRVETFTTGGF